MFRIKKSLRSCLGGGQFRHFYSDILSTLQRINANDEAEVDALLINLEKIKKIYCSDNIKEGSNSPREDPFYKTLNKLFDHVSLEISRMESANVIARRVFDNEEKLKNLKEATEASEANYKKLKSKTFNIQKDFVAILGIFSGIVMVFAGGLSFTNAALGNIANANIWKLLALVLAIGLVLGHTLYGLFYYIGSFTREERINKYNSLWATIAIIIAIIICLCFAYLADQTER